MSNKHKGFTLIELMLATSLLMLVMFSGYYAYSLYTQKWQKRVQFFWQGTEQAMALDVINRMLISITPYVVKCKNNKECIYFSGSTNSMRFVTDSPIYSQNSALVELTIEQVNGSYQLMYKEHSLHNSALLTLDNTFNDDIWQKQSVLLSGLQSIQWSYYGWKSFSDALTQSNISEVNDIHKNKDTRLWYFQHDANEIRILPLNIQLKIMTTETSNISEWLIALSNNSIFKLIADLRVDA